MSTSLPYHAEYALRTIFKRCVVCPEGEQPSCPTCASGQTCIQRNGDGCNTCTQALCVEQSSSGLTQTQSSSGGGTNVGAIAGGVVGGVAFIVILTFVIWRFCIRPRYHYPEQEEYSEEYADYSEKSPGDDGGYQPTAQARNSTHSVRSVASTVMTRASNVIQIAFIPGITDRQGHEDGSNNSPVPPVPAIPAHQRTTTASSNTPVRHPGTPDLFLTPQDLHSGSRWSQFSNSTMGSEDIRSTRHQSLASSLARESVASTIFQDHQATPMSAAQGVRGKANVVSVKPSTGTTPGSTGHVPEIPTVDYFKYGESKKKNEEASKGAQTPADAGPSVVVGGAEANPSSDAHSNDSKKPSSRMLAAAIEEATRRASRQPTHGGLGGLGPNGSKSSGLAQSSQLAQPQQGQGQLRERDPSPFSDSNAVQTP